MHVWILQARAGSRLLVQEADSPRMTHLRIDELQRA
jgi:hypothetical protein